MKKERLFTVISLVNKKISLNCIKEIDSFEISKNDFFIFIRDEFLFNVDEGIEELKNYYDIPNLEDLVELELNKVFYSPYLINCHLEDILNDNKEDNELYEELLSLYEYFSKDIEVITFEKYLELSKNEMEKDNSY